MSVSAMFRLGIGLAAAAGLAVAGSGQALAAGVPGVRSAPRLHATTRIGLGTTKNAFHNVFTEAPNGAVFYSRGAVVSVVNGHSAPHVVLRASGRVFALAGRRTERSHRALLTHLLVVDVQSLRLNIDHKR